MSMGPTARSAQFTALMPDSYNAARGLGRFCWPNSTEAPASPAVKVKASRCTLPRAKPVVSTPRPNSALFRLAVPPTCSLRLASSAPRRAPARALASAMGSLLPGGTRSLRSQVTKGLLVAQPASTAAQARVSASRWVM